MTKLVCSACGKELVLGLVKAGETFMCGQIDDWAYAVEVPEQKLA